MVLGNCSTKDVVKRILADRDMIFEFLESDRYGLPEIQN